MKPSKLEAVGALLGNYNDLGYDPVTDTMSYYKNQTPPTKAEIDTKLAELISAWEAQAYARKRKSEYPAIAEQLDILYHSGVAGLQAELKKTKDKFPKG